MEDSNDHGIMYCSKCAVSMASKGIKMTEFSKNAQTKPKTPLTQKPQNSKSRLDNFILGLDKMIPESEKMVEELNNRKFNSVKHFDKQIQHVNEIFSKLNEMTEDIHSKTISTINIFRGRYLEASTHYEKEAKKAIWEMQAMFSDVSGNKDSIQKEIEEEVLNQILSKYEEKLIHAQAVLKTLQEEQITLHALDEKLNLENIRTQIESSMNFKSMTQQLLPANEVYVSFENGEFFRNQMKTDSTKESRNNTVNTDSGEKRVRTHRRNKSNIQLSELDPNTNFSRRQNYSTTTKNAKSVDSKRTPDNTKEKYLNLLTKIATNQSKLETNCDELKNRSTKSPKFDSSFEPHSNEKVSQFENSSKRKVEESLKEKSVRSSPDSDVEEEGSIMGTEKKVWSDNSGVKSKSSNESSIKNEKFLSFIEKKLDEQNRNNGQRNFQKTLFCSPSFKGQTESPGVLDESSWIHESAQNSYSKNSDCQEEEIFLGE